MGKFPISKVCPQCRSNEYTARKPKEFIAFANDRVCKVCLTRYSPPIPVWGAMIFLLSALALPILGFFLIALLFNPFSLLGLACEGAFCIIALVVFIGLIRQLATSSNVGGAEIVGNSCPADLEGSDKDSRAS